MGMPERYALLIMDNGRWLGVANFSPATSVTLIDLDTRKIVGEIPTPDVCWYIPRVRAVSVRCAPMAAS